MTDTCRARHSRRLEALKTERSIYESHWSNLDKFIAPGRYRLNHQQDRKFFAGRYKEIVDETSLLAFRIMRSGMMSGQTSPSRPWFRMTTMDPDLREVESVKEYLYQCETRMRQMLQSSNVYNVLHNSYGDEGQFGQSASILVDDDLDTVRALPLVTGQFWLAQNHRHRVDTLYRLCPMTVEQVVGRFVVMPGGDMDWSRVSNTVKNLWDNSSYDEWVRIYHAVEPRRDRDQTKADKRNKTFLSNYWEDAGVRDTMLEESGFDMNPIIAPRWETVANDVYASNFPGEMSLPSTRQIQFQQKKKARAIEKGVDPTLVAHSSMKNTDAWDVPGGIVFHDSPGTVPPVRSAFDMVMNLDHLRGDISETQDRNNRVWYADLFMAISQMEGVQPRNVFELTARKEEQLLQLGPVIDRQQYEKLNPLIDWLYAMGVRKNLFPPPPAELQGQVLKIDHISVLAQAQKAVSTGAIERGLAFAGNIAAMKPDVLDKLDLDQAVDEYWDAVGAPPTITRSDDEVAQIRKGREAQQAAAANAEMAGTVMPAVKQGADAARVLSEIGQQSGGVQPNELLSRLGIAG